MIMTFPNDLPKKEIANFAIAVAEKNTHMGCAAVRFSRGFYNHFLVTGNFVTTNIIGNPVYTVGDRATACCKNWLGRAYVFPSLCFTTQV